jgi:hypothetical protein
LLDRESDVAKKLQQQKRHISADERAAYPPPDPGTLPSAETTETVWRLIEPRLSARLTKLVPDFTAKQALVVVLDRCVQVGEEPEWKKTHGRWTRGKRRTVTRNHIFEALASKWSPNFRAVCERGRPELGLAPTNHIRNQRLDTAALAWRELLIGGVRIADLWKLVVSSGWSWKEKGKNPLFYLTRPNPKSASSVV